MTPDILNTVHTLLVLVIGAVSAPLSRQLTALVKSHWNTTGITTTAVNGVLSALLAGVFSYLAGAYGHGQDGVIRALCATLVAAFGAAGAHQAAISAGVTANAINGSTPDGTYPPAVR